MRINAVRDALKTGQRAVDNFKASQEAATDTWCEGRETVERYVEGARDRMEDLLYQATRKIKRQPLAAVGLALGIGALVGLLISKTSRD